MKQAGKLALYLAATILIGALLAPLLLWAAQSLATHGILPVLAKYDFDRFFHRALLIAAVSLLWPLLRLSGVRGMADLQLARNKRWGRDILAGVLLSGIPLLCCGVLLIAFRVYFVRQNFSWSQSAKILPASIAVPLIEEAFFRGIMLGILLKSGWKYMSIFATSAIFSVIHFLKAPPRGATIVTWTSGFNSIGHSFEQFGDAALVISAFATLFLIGWVLADARVCTRSLWLSIGLHAGWIFASGTFNRVARQQILFLPWLGKNLLVGIVPLGLALLTWLLMRMWLKYDCAAKA